MDAVGRVVILNGTSSSGKSTLIDAFCERRAEHGELWLRTGIDDYIGKMPLAFVDVPGFEGRRGAQGFRVLAREGHVVFDAGPTAQRVLRGYRRTVATWARQGLDVIVDEVVLGSEAAVDWTEALAGLSVLWVAVRCLPEVTARREFERGDRVLGLAAGQAATVHERVRYGAEVDTTHATPDASVAVLESAIDAFEPFHQRGPISTP